MDANFCYVGNARSLGLQIREVVEHSGLSIQFGESMSCRVFRKFPQGIFGFIEVELVWFVNRWRTAAVEKIANELRKKWCYFYSRN